MQNIDWLLDSDPAIRWQVLRDLTDASADEVASERSRIATEGWGARILAMQDPSGYWGGQVYGKRQARDSVQWTLQLLRRMGADPASPEVAAAVDRVRDGVVWDEFDDRPYFSGEVEECVNGGVLAVAAYFGRLDAGAEELVGRLLREQLDDGGWNCDPIEESTVSSVDSTICVLEGLAEYERVAGAVPEVAASRRRGEEYLLERHLFRRRSTGEVIQERYLEPAFPPYWFHDVLRGLDYFREAGLDSGTPADDRLGDAVEVLVGARRPDGRWAAGEGRPARMLLNVPIEVAPDEPSRWNTLRSLRVLDWVGAD